jgi:hypothetical protein
MKKLTQEQFDLLIDKVIEFRKHPGLRLGQAMFNVFYFIDPDTATELTGTDADPFYSDEKIPQFLAAIADDETIQNFYAKQYMRVAVSGVA